MKKPRAIAVTPERIARLEWQMREIEDDARDSWRRAREGERRSAAIAGVLLLGVAFALWAHRKDTDSAILQALLTPR